MVAKLTIAEREDQAYQAGYKSLFAEKGAKDLAGGGFEAICPFKTKRLAKIWHMGYMHANSQYHYDATRAAV